MEKDKINYNRTFGTRFQSFDAKCAEIIERYKLELNGTDIRAAFEIVVTHDDILGSKAELRFDESFYIPEIIKPEVHNIFNRYILDYQWDTLLQN